MKVFLLVETSSEGMIYNQIFSDLSKAKKSAENEVESHLEIDDKGNFPTVEFKWLEGDNYPNPTLHDEINEVKFEVFEVEVQ